MVSRVIDGDTVHVLPAGGGERITVRLLGIDAPEVGDYGGQPECWGAQASAFARDTLLDRPVRLVADPTQDERDRYGRTLGYQVLAGGRDFSVLAAAAGAVRSYTYDRPVVEYPAIARAEAEARFARRGLWGACPVR